MPSQTPPLNPSPMPRYFRSAFAAVGTKAVDLTTHTLKDAVMIRPGEALGHGFWIDSAFCSQVVTLGNTGKKAGLKARFGHPNMCSDAIGTYLGRWENLRAREDGAVIGDLHLSAAAAEAPSGDLRKYVEELAAKEPDHFGASIVFDHDPKSMREFEAANTKEITFETKDASGAVIKTEQRRVFQTPDPNNKKNLRHARCAALYAADLVDSPAATDGMFSQLAGAEAAAQWTEWLDLHPEVFQAIQEPGIVAMLTSYQDRLADFLTKYSASVAQAREAAAKLGQTQTAPEAAQPAPAATPPPPAQPDEALKAELEAAKTENARLASELSKATTRATELEAANKQLAADSEAGAGKAKTLNTRIVELETALKDAQQKLAAFAAGSPPVSSNAAESQKKTSGSLMQRARGETPN